MQSVETDERQGVIVRSLEDLRPSCGPLYLEGRLVLSLSFCTDVFDNDGNVDDCHAMAPEDGHADLAGYALDTDAQLDGRLDASLEDCSDGQSSVRPESRSDVQLGDRSDVLRNAQSDGQSDASTVAPSDTILEAYQVWDALTDTCWLPEMVAQRYENGDVVVRWQPSCVMMWRGALDTQARIISVPDLDEEGYEQNQSSYLYWRRMP